MPKFSKLTPYLKALVSPLKMEEDVFAKSYPARWTDLVNMSPKEQGDISGVIVPMQGADNFDKTIDTDYLNKVFVCHDLVHSAIDLVSSTFALGNLRVKKRVPNTTNTYEYVPDHPLQVLLNKPNSSMTGFDLRQAFAVHRLLYGTIALVLLRGEMIDDNMSPNNCPACTNQNANHCIHILWKFNTGDVTQIIPIHLDRLKEEVVAVDGKPTSVFMYEFDGITMPIHKNNIITDPNYNPAGSFYGTSPTMSIKRWLEADFALSTQTSAYFSNNAIPSLVINLKPGTDPYEKDPSEILDMLRERWMAKFSLRGDGTRAGTSVKGPAFVYGDIDFHKIQDTLKDIIVQDLFYEIQNRVAMAYKVPKSFFLFGVDYSSQSATARQQREDFYNDAISPLQVSFKLKIERHLFREYPDGHELKLEWDNSDMGIASFLEEKKKNAIYMQWELGMIRLDEARTALGYDPISGNEGLSRYRVSVMSDGIVNVGGPNEDNRFTVGRLRTQVEKDLE